MSKLLKRDDPAKFTLGTVYSPQEVDTQGDFATAAEIEKACWNFNRNLQAPLSKAALGLVDALAKAAEGQSVTLEVDTDLLTKGALGVQHADWSDDIGEILESYIAPCDMQIGEELVTKGSWLMGVKWSEDNWAKVEKGEITGYSLGGTGIRVKE